MYTIGTDRKKSRKKTRWCREHRSAFFSFFQHKFRLFDQLTILIVHFRPSSSFSRFCFFFSLHIFFFGFLGLVPHAGKMGGYLFTASKRNQWERQRGQHIFFPNTLCPYAVCVCVSAENLLLICVCGGNQKKDRMKRERERA